VMNGSIVSKQASVLLVEDNIDTQDLIWVLLQNSGYSIATASSFRDGLALALSANHDLIIIDNWLPDGTGIELCRRIREHNAKVPILFLTAAAYEDNKNDALAAGAQCYLTKPAGIKRLPDAIASLIAESKSQS